MTGLEFIALLAQLSTIARTARDFFGRPREEVNREVERRADQFQASPQLQQAVARISPEVRDAYGRRLKKAYDRYIDVINDPAARPYDWNDARDRAQYDICAVLELVKQHNGGTLPDDLDDTWNEFSCDNPRP